MTALGFYATLEQAGFGDLGVIVASDEQRVALLRLLDELFATGARDDWVARLRAADIVSAPINTLLEASNDPDVVANGYVAEMDYPAYGKRLKVHGSPWQFSENAGADRGRARHWASTTMRCWRSLATVPRRSADCGREGSSDLFRSGRLGRHVARAPASK